METPDNRSDEIHANLRYLVKNGKVVWKRLPKSESLRQKLLLGVEIPPEFDTQKMQLWWMANQKSRPKCLCGKNTNFLSLSGGFSEFCSVSCASAAPKTNEKRKQTSMLHFGVEHPHKSDKVKKKTEETFISRYGVSRPLQAPAIKQKMMSTNLLKYGVPFAAQSDEVKTKHRENNKRKYGTESTLSLPEVRNKIRTTNITRYGHQVAVHGAQQKQQIKLNTLNKFGVEHHFQRNDVKEKTKQQFISSFGVEHPALTDAWHSTRMPAYRKTIFIKICKRLETRGLFPNFTEQDFIGVNHRYRFLCRCGNIFTSTLINGNIPRCLTCRPIRYGKKQLEVFQFIQEIYEGEILYNDRLAISPKELDILIPALNLAFEFNGNFWHSGRFLKPDYHEIKTKLANQAGIHLYHIWESEWDSSREKVKNIINQLVAERL